MLFIAGENCVPGSMRAIVGALPESGHPRPWISAGVGVYSAVICGPGTIWNPELVWMPHGSGTIRKPLNCVRNGGSTRQYCRDVVDGFADWPIGASTAMHWSVTVLP